MQSVERGREEKARSSERDAKYYKTLHRENGVVYEEQKSKQQIT